MKFFLNIVFFNEKRAKRWGAGAGIKLFFWNNIKTTI
jgi:hypothetical protein